MIQSIHIKGILVRLCMLEKYLEGEYVRVYEDRKPLKRTLLIIVVIRVFKQVHIMNKERLEDENVLWLETRLIVNIHVRELS